MKRIFILLVAFVVPAAGLAQTELMRTNEGSSVTAEVLIPSFKNEFGYTFTGMTILLSGKVTISDMFSIHAEVPYVQSKMEYSSPFGSTSTSKGSIGNTYLGLGIGPSNGVLSGDFGFRLNTLSEDNSSAVFSGIFGDMPNVERYLPETMAIQAGVNFQPQILNNFSLLARFAPSLWIEKNGDGDNMWFSHYGLGAAYQIDVVRVGAGVNGLWQMSEEGFLFGNKDAVHHFQAEVNARFGMIRPGVMFRVPLDKELDMTKSTIGLNVSVLF